MGTLKARHLKCRKIRIGLGIWMIDICVINKMMG